MLSTWSGVQRLSPKNRAKRARPEANSFPGLSSRVCPSPPPVSKPPRAPRWAHQRRGSPSTQAGTSRSGRQSPRGGGSSSASGEAADEVYLVWDDRLFALVVAKILRPDQAEDARSSRAPARSRGARAARPPRSRAWLRRRSRGPLSPRLARASRGPHPPSPDLYVQPLYMAAQRGRLPELKRVIAAYGERIAMEETLESSLQKIFEGGPVSPTGVATKAPPGDRRPCDPGAQPLPAS